MIITHYRARQVSTNANKNKALHPRAYRTNSLMLITNQHSVVGVLTSIVNRIGQCFSTKLTGYDGFYNYYYYYEHC